MSSQKRKRSAVDEVVEALFSTILDGSWPPGTRLPTERELAAQFDASRSTIRSAIARLIEWRVVVTRQGSGARVLERRSWKADVTPYVFYHLVGTGEFEQLGRLFQDGFFFQRFLVLGLMEQAAGDLEGSDLSSVRALVDRAWEHREDPARFMKYQRQILPEILERAGRMTSLWFLNSIATPYLGTMAAIARSAEIPDSFSDLLYDTIDALEDGDAARARASYEAALDDIDQAIRDALPAPLAKELES
jgi:DNA-binding FadR family transcriptional regulator